MMPTLEEFIEKLYQERARRNRLKQLMMDKLAMDRRKRRLKFKLTGRGGKR